jgi:glycosyltransferase involved in cell wall biosynthesis
MTRILMLSNLYPPNVVGGYERLCFEVAEGLVAAGHEVSVLTTRYGGKEQDFPGQTVMRQWDLLTGPDIYTPFPGTAEDRARVNQANLATLHRVLAAVKPDVVFSWNLFFLDASLLDALERSRIRTVVMLTDNWLLVMREPLFVHHFFQDTIFGNAPLKKLPPPSWMVRLKRRLLGRQPQLEAIFGAAYMREFYAAGGIEFKRSRVIHNGVKQRPDAARPPPDRTKLVEPGTLRLLFAGRLVDLKGAHTAVAALAFLDPAALGVARVQLTIVGDAQDKAYIEQLDAAIAQAGVAAQIERLPSVPESELPALFNAYDIYLFPSLYEPFSLTLIHALALGIPTIASNTGGNPEIVTDDESGLLFAKGDAADLARAVTALAPDGARRARLAAGGQRAAAAFTFERMVREMAAFLSP